MGYSLVVSDISFTSKCKMPSGLVLLNEVAELPWLPAGGSLGSGRSPTLGGAAIRPRGPHRKLPLSSGVGTYPCGYVLWEHPSAAYVAVKYSGWIVGSHLRCIGLQVPSQCQVLSEAPSDGVP